MRGEVEVYRIIRNKEPELIAKESNLLVDGAAKTVVDMLTTTPSLSGVESASSLLDTSNYMVQAISFGKPWQLFSSGIEYISAHFPGSGTVPAGGNLSELLFKSSASATLDSGGSGAPGTGRMLCLTHDTTESVSSLTWQHLKDTPEGISPTDTRLQQNSTRTFYQNHYNEFLTTKVNVLSSVGYLSANADANGLEFSSFYLSGDAKGDLEPGFDNGQNLNLLALSSVQSAYFQSAIDLAETTSGIIIPNVPDSTNTQNSLSTLEYPSNLIGCYPPSDGIELILLGRSFSNRNDQFYASKYNSKTDNIAENQIIASSNFNWQGKESMDASGWVNLINPEGVGTVGDPDDGLVVSAQDDGSFSSTGEIVYKVTVSGGDAACASMFGGIWYMGLWTFDNSAILCNGVTPPYSWNNLTNPRRYRLFSKKAFTKDITYHIDNGATAGLKDLADNGRLEIIWRIYV